MKILHVLAHERNCQTTERVFRSIGVKIININININTDTDTNIDIDIDTDTDIDIDTDTDTDTDTDIDIDIDNKIKKPTLPKASSSNEKVSSKSRMSPS